MAELLEAHYGDRDPKPSPASAGQIGIMIRNKLHSLNQTQRGNLQYLHDKGWLNDNESLYGKHETKGNIYADMPQTGRPDPRFFVTFGKHKKTHNG